VQVRQALRVLFQGVNAKGFGTYPDGFSPAGIAPPATPASIAIRSPLREMRLLLRRDSAPSR
jgi:hypothetical protein